MSSPRRKPSWMNLGVHRHGLSPLLFRKAKWTLILHRYFVFMNEPHTPLNLTAQPSTYPRNSLYQFDNSGFNAAETLDALETMIRTSLVGSTFHFERATKSKLGLRRFTLFCCHHKSISQNKKNSLMDATVSNALKNNP